MDIFFRADDAGWSNDRFERLASLFAFHGHHLNAAAIPLACRQSPPALPRGAVRDAVEFHSHGWAHLDHETSGKKSEFGASRSPDTVARELTESRSALAELLGDRYFPAFVPPWNRIDERFLPLLPAAGFRAISRDGIARASCPGLDELNINVDLHTSRVPPPATPAGVLAATTGSGLRTGGIMLHHARMAETDFTFLNELLGLMTQRGIQSRFISELIS